jgi:hypothetical protein
VAVSGNVVGDMFRGQALSAHCFGIKGRGSSQWEVEIGSCAAFLSHRLSRYP